MNTFFAYPIAVPSPSRGGSIDENFLWAMLIVTTAIWLFILMFTLIHNAIINAKSDLKYELSDREYFLIASFLCSIIDGIVLFVMLVKWVSTLL